MAMGSEGHRSSAGVETLRCANMNSRLLENALGAPGSDGHSGSQLIGNKTPESQELLMGPQS